MVLEDATSSLLKRAGGGDGLFQTDVPGLIVMRSSVPTRPQAALYHPSLCLIVQGAKEMIAGESRLAYRAGQSVVITANIPTLGQITDASPQYPFIGLGLRLQLNEMREVLKLLNGTAVGKNETASEMIVDETPSAIQDCLVRLLQAAERLGALPVLQPSIMREICYWLLVGSTRARIARQLEVSGSAQRIEDVVFFIRENFTDLIRIDQLAALANMSPSSLFHHFRSATEMTPHQFQKKLKLSEARRLLVMNGLSVATVAFNVGYESASQFSREYRQMFGVSPGRDTSFFHERLQKRDEGGRRQRNGRVVDGSLALS